MHNKEDSPTPSYIEILVSPKGRAKDLLQIKKFLNLIWLCDLLRGSKQLPFTIIRNITYANALNRIEKSGKLADVLKLVTSDENKF